MPDPLPIQGVNHISRATTKLEASRRFYRDVLGFREIARPDFDFDGAWLYNYGVQIHLIARGGTDPASGKEIQTRASHVAFDVSDLEQTRALLEAHGIEYRENHVPKTGVTQLFFHDPDGYHIEVAVYPPTPPFLD